MVGIDGKDWIATCENGLYYCLLCWSGLVLMVVLHGRAGTTCLK